MRTPRSVAASYHESTKYAPETMGQIPGADFGAQPVPFKQYHTDRAIDLISYLPPELFPEVTEADGEPDDDTTLLARLSRLLYFTYGATGRQVWPGGHQILRAAPSAGGLYPVEVYLATQGVDGTPDALHDYFAPNHQLVPVFDGQWIDELADFGYGAFDPTNLRAVLVLTGVYARSTWRYHERAYRRILLDTGHVFGNVACYSAHHGFDALPVCCFHDAALNGAFFFDPEEEQAQLLVAIFDRPQDDPVPTSLGWRRDSHPASSSHGSFLEYHRASSLSERASAISRSSATVTTSLNSQRLDLQHDPTLENAEVDKLILSRRSTREFSGESVSWTGLCRILRTAYDPVRHQLTGAETTPLCQVPELLHTHLLIQSVEGLDPGVYELDPTDCMLSPTRLGDFGDEAVRFSLGQDLARDAAAIVIHSANLPHAIEEYGERVYRALHIDAGVVGQFLNLAALHEGVGVSGIGGFFDDHVNTALGLPADHGILYLTVIGQTA